MTRSVFDRVDSRATIVALMAESLGGADEPLFDRVVARRSTLVVAGRGSWRDLSLAVGLWSDYFVVGQASVLEVVSHPSCEIGSRQSPSRLASISEGGGGTGGAVSAGVVRRIGRAALPLLLSESGAVEAREAISLGLADALLPDGADPAEWIRDWVGPRNATALHSGASLVRRGGGDMMERAEFARLFATGEPQRGLGRFLEKKPLDFSEDLIVETI